MIATRGNSMSKHRSSLDQNLLFFPDAETPIGGEKQSVAIRGPLSPVTGYAVALQSDPAQRPGAGCDVVISGTYRKDFETLRHTYEEFLDLGCTILSPSNVSIVSEHDGFVYMRGEERETPEKIESRHLAAIQQANFVWLHTPEGYVGPTAALEIGFAHAAGVPVYATQAPSDKVLRSFVRVVESPANLLSGPLRSPAPPAPALKAFQEYYRRAALERGYAKEGPKDCLLLMVEEVGELARSLRKREKLVRHGSYQESNEAHELADVFLYVVHMANVLGFDLAHIVRDKEILNLKRFLAT
jgi:NTP pyrophosphatase (non-canonical NTP hydrolase)